MRSPLCCPPVMVSDPYPSSLDMPAPSDRNVKTISVSSRRDSKPSKVALTGGLPVKRIREFFQISELLLLGPKWKPYESRCPYWKSLNGLCELSCRHADCRHEMLRSRSRSGSRSMGLSWQSAICCGSSWTRPARICDGTKPNSASCTTMS